MLALFDRPRWKTQRCYSDDFKENGYYKLITPALQGTCCRPRRGAEHCVVLLQQGEEQQQKEKEEQQKKEEKQKENTAYAKKIMVRLAGLMGVGGAVGMVYVFGKSRVVLLWLKTNAPDSWDSFISGLPSLTHSLALSLSPFLCLSFSLPPSLSVCRE